MRIMLKDILSALSAQGAGHHFISSSLHLAMINIEKRQKRFLYPTVGLNETFTPLWLSFVVAR
jgi:hypothetical protein